MPMVHIHVHSSCLQACPRQTDKTPNIEFVHFIFQSLAFENCGDVNESAYNIFNVVDQRLDLLAQFKTPLKGGGVKFPSEFAMQIETEPLHS